MAKTKEVEKNSFSAQEVIEAADEALKKKNEAIESTQAALTLAQQNLIETQDTLIKRDQSLEKNNKNGLLMMSIGGIGGALLAVNAVAPGIGVLGLGALIILFNF